MALYSLRLRRTLATVSSIHRVVSATHAVSAPASSYSLFQPSGPVRSHNPILHPQSWMFRSSSVPFSSARTSFGNEDDKIGPDTILFEGCDYNHWLITMDFPKDPKPTPEEMVRTYEETCAKGLNISLEEAKKKMYACSTTTYQGFQAVMTEEESEKFRGLPGVVFILPDSYIDPQNKEYGGDKYINGTIIPRPPPVQYGRQGGRYRDRNRNPDQPRYNRQGPPPNWQGNPSNTQQGSYQGGSPNFGPPQNYPPQQNYGASQQNYGSSQQNYGQPQQNYGSAQQTYGQPQQNDGSQQQTYGQPQQNYPRQQQNNAPPQQSYNPTYQGGQGGSMPSYQGQMGEGSYNQGGQGNYYPGYGDSRGDNRGYSPSQGGYGQGMGGYQGQGTGGPYGQSTNSGSSGQGDNSDFGSKYPQGGQRN